MDSNLLNKLERLLGEATPTVIVVTYTGGDGEVLSPSAEEIEAARQCAIEEGLPHIVVYPDGYARD